MFVMQLTGMMVANTVDLKLYLVDIFSIFQIQCFDTEIVKVKWPEMQENILNVLFQT